MSALATLNTSLLVFAMFMVLVMGARKIYTVIITEARARASEEQVEEDEEDEDDAIQVTLPKRRIKLSARHFIPLDFIHRRPRRRPPDTPPPAQ